MLCFGDYECISKVGEGATSLVYLTRSQNNCLPLVLKVSKKSSEIENELRILKKVQHKGIIKLIDNFRDDSKQVCIVLEYGKDLFDYIISNGGFSEKYAREKMKIIFEAIRFLHSKKIIHRDIKLENIIMTEKGNLKLIDFGLALSMDDEVDKNKIQNNYYYNKEKKKSVCGTSYYLAPEILKGQFYDEKVDAWELGVTLFAAVTAVFPFDSSNDYAYTIEVMTKEPNFEGLEASKDFVDLIGHMLEKDPTKRYSVEECLNHKWFKL